MATILGSLEFFTVRYLVVGTTADSSDPDDLPDFSDINGRAIFTPNLAPGSVLKYPAADWGDGSGVSREFELVPQKRVVPIVNGRLAANEGGYLKLEASSSYVNPLNWTWRVEFEMSTPLGKIKRDPFSIPAIPNSEVNLASVAPVGGTVGTPITQGPPGMAVGEVVLIGGDTLRFIGNDIDATVLSEVEIPALLYAPQAEAARDAAIAAKDLAVSSRDDAAGYATAASGSATAAGNSATAAAGSASTASGHATTAGTANTNAQSAKTAAEAAKTAAETARDVAQGHATSAMGYRDTASTHATNAGTANTNAQSAKTAAETARDTAQGYRDTAQTYRDQAETFKNAAEAAAAAAAAGTVPDNAVSTVKIQDNAVTTPKLADNSVNSAKIIDGSIVNADINASAAIAGSKIAAGTITGTQIATDAIGTLQLGDNAVDTAAIAGSAVTTPKIGDGQVTGPKIADGSVDSAKIADGSIVNADISSSAAIAASKVAVPADFYVVVMAGTRNAATNSGTGDLILGVPILRPFAVEEAEWVFGGADASGSTSVKLQGKRAGSVVDIVGSALTVTAANQADTDATRTARTTVIASGNANLQLGDRLIPILVSTGTTPGKLLGVHIKGKWL